MKTINMLILINPSQNRRETEKMAYACSADRFILVDADLDFADQLALILEKRRQKVAIIPHLEGLEQLFSTVEDFPYSIAVEYYGAGIGR
ncbi:MULTISPECIES: hypothetical protein [Sphingobacterium]|uniref:Uncharacterized protein n=1 Tax=Sphingobacterium athyrii TaxID=2152717 RepID=A0A363NYN9_9SPHI|nr:MULTISPECIES: hypothetical protein [Sphingobacterium]PUV25781.1 hypothetical protein DCO56_02040 [Sphingobacterium athyrii]